MNNVCRMGALPYLKGHIGGSSMLIDIVGRCQPKINGECMIKMDGVTLSILTVIPLVKCPKHHSCCLINLADIG